MPESEMDVQLKAFNQIVQLLKQYDTTTRAHILKSVVNWLQLKPQDLVDQFSQPAHSPTQPRSQPVYTFSEHTELSPKAFLLEKSPQTKTERVACLAYYLTHYRETPHFKTFDISKLNTEAAQPKFSNAAYFLNEALKAGLLVPGPRASKQISAIGEQFVQALPDRAAAQSVLTVKKERRPKRTTTPAREPLTSAPPEPQPSDDPNDPAPSGDTQ